MPPSCFCFSFMSVLITFSYITWKLINAFSLSTLFCAVSTIYIISPFYFPQVWAVRIWGTCYKGRIPPSLDHFLQMGSWPWIHFMFAYCISLILRAKALNGWWGLLFLQSTILNNRYAGNSYLTEYAITWKYRSLKITLFSTVSKTHFRAAIWIPATLSLKKMDVCTCDIV